MLHLEAHHARHNKAHTSYLKDSNFGVMVMPNTSISIIAISYMMQIIQFDIYTLQQKSHESECHTNKVQDYANFHLADQEDLDIKIRDYICVSINLALRSRIILP